MEKNTHKVLALKYRPKNFKELIGQDIMVETITNSIKLNKLPNAYLLTGIRGVGKTTTARLIAKALNCNKNFLKEENCNCRKPKTELISNDERSPKDIFIGDQITDMQCAFYSGVKNRWLISECLKSQYETRRALNHNELINNFDYWYLNDIG